MGLLIDGEWHDKWYDTDNTGGRFERDKSRFRNWVTSDGSPGPTGEGGFTAATNRYHLYVALACPWAHRTLIFRRLKGLESWIPITVVNPVMREHGWTFEPGRCVETDPMFGAQRLYEVYQQAAPQYTGRVTVPVLWDKQQQTIVSNESSEIIRMFNSACDELGATPGDYYPVDLRDDIDAVNAWVYSDINNGVYRAGFATTQEAYEEAVTQLFAALDRVEERLAAQRYLCGERITEADWRLFTTLVRFDAVYHGHFKCNLRRLVDYPHIAGYVRELYQWPGVEATVDLPSIKQHYYASHATINPTGIIPLGPIMDLHAPHGRGHLPGQSAPAA